MDQGFSKLGLLNSNLSERSKVDGKRKMFDRWQDFVRQTDRELECFWENKSRQIIQESKAGLYRKKLPSTRWQDHVSCLGNDC